jgi:hypothetical protein
MRPCVLYSRARQDGAQDASLDSADTPHSPSRFFSPQPCAQQASVPSMGTATEHVRRPLPLWCSTAQDAAMNYTGVHQTAFCV